MVNQEEKDLAEFPSSLKIALLEEGYVHTDFVYKLAVAAFAAGRRQCVHDITGHALRATGAQLIAVERHRQIDEEGFTSERDDKYKNAELTCAAMDYADSARKQMLGGSNAHIMRIGNYWKWDGYWWKPSLNPLHNLVKSGGLIAAEIDRLQRKESNNGTE